MADQDWLESLQKLVEVLLGGPGAGGTRDSLTPGVWGIFTDARPSAEDKDGELIILSGEGGIPPFSNLAGLRRYEFEVRTIAPARTPDDAKAKADEIYDLLKVQGPQTSSDGRLFDFFELLSHPARDDVDATGHFEYAFTCRTQVRE
jgi:hypothetical protein